MKKLLGLISFVALVAVGHSQQDYQFTQFQFDKVSLNPGAIGMETNCLGLFYRNQWLDLSGEPKTFLVNYHMPVKVLKGGLGITALSDNLGNQRSVLGETIPNAGPAVTNSGVRLSYSYHHKLSPGTLGVGLSIGYQAVETGANWFAIDDPLSDPAIPNSIDNAGAADFNFGVYFKGQNYWAGLSATHLSAPQLQGTTVNFDVSRHYYFMAGTSHFVGDFEINPALLVKSDFVSTSVDLNVTATWNDLVWAGVGYRSQDALNPMAGVQVPMPIVPNLDHSLRLGFSYDIGLSDLAKASNGGLEVFLGYCWKFTPPIIRKSHGNPRFL